mgnify:CR=1 FL=1
MKRIKTFIVLSFVSGGVLGFLINTSIRRVLSGNLSYSPYSKMYSASVLKTATDVIQLTEGKCCEVLERKKASLPSSTKCYYECFMKSMPDDKSRYECLWQVENYYKMFGEQVPSIIKPILDSLPENPF